VAALLALFVHVLVTLVSRVMDSRPVERSRSIRASRYRVNAGFLHGEGADATSATSCQGNGLERKRWLFEGVPLV